MACVRKRRVGKGYRWVLDYRDQQGRRHWETTKGNRKEAEGLLAERVAGDRAWYLPGSGGAGDLRGPGCCLLEARRGQRPRNDHQGLQVQPDPTSDCHTSRAGSCGTSGGPMSKPSGRTCSMRASGRRTVNKCLTLLGARCSATPCATNGVRRTPPKAPSSAPVRAGATISSRRTSLPLPRSKRFWRPLMRRWRVIILTAVLTGLREGELLGLAWGDIDWQTRQIHVRQQYTAGRFSELKTTSLEAPGGPAGRAGGRASTLAARSARRGLMISCSRTAWATRRTPAIC